MNKKISKIVFITLISVFVCTGIAGAATLIGNQITMTGAGATGIDLSGASFTTSDLTLQNGETISNAANGIIDFGAAILKTTGSLNTGAIDTNNGNITTGTGNLSTNSIVFQNGVSITNPSVDAMMLGDANIVTTGQFRSGEIHTYDADIYTGDGRIVTDNILLKNSDSIINPTSGIISFNSTNLETEGTLAVGGIRLLPNSETITNTIDGIINFNNAILQTSGSVVSGKVAVATDLVIPTSASAEPLLGSIYLFDNGVDFYEVCVYTSAGWKDFGGGACGS